MSDQPSITCPRCGMTSYHPMDIQYGYCGNCHAYTGDEPRVSLMACPHNVPNFGPPCPICD